ncbi:MAG: hypothetical protein ACJASN_001091 [Cyclobacteriaceae bacterium]
MAVSAEIRAAGSSRPGTTERELTNFLGSSKLQIYHHLQGNFEPRLLSFGKIVALTSVRSKIKPMKHFSIILSLIVLTLLTSCTEEELIERKEDRLYGTWQFEKAFFLSTNSLFRNNISHLYEHDEITFYSDLTATYKDDNQRAIYTGDWFVILEVFPDDFDGTENVYFLDAFFYGDRPQDDFGYYAEIEWLTRKRLRLFVMTPEGEYTFRLSKQ